MTTDQLAAGGKLTAPFLAPTKRPGVPASNTGLVLARIFAGITIVIIAFKIDLLQGITVGTALALLLSPFWLRTIRRYWGMTAFFLFVVVAIGAGLWLTDISSADHQTSLSLAVTSIAVLVEAAAGIGVILWARTFMSDAWIAALFGLGLVLGVSPSADRFAANPWRFGYSVAVTVLVVAFAHFSKKRWLEVLIFGALIVASGLTDARSSFGLLLLAALLTIWQLRPRSKKTRGSPVRVVLGIVVLAIVVFNVGQSLILDGYLGDATQQRSQDQINTSGSLILGGRPEIAATTALMQNQPFGFGVGTIPSFNDILVAKTGMASINYAPNNGYVENYMFGGQFQLHSMIGDLWAQFGLAGIVLSVLILMIGARGMSIGIAAGTASGVLLYVGVKTLWNLAFSPFLTSVPLLILFLGLAATERVSSSVTARVTARVGRAKKAHAEG